jgi:lysophospholipase L1-like esterase
MGLSNKEKLADIENLPALQAYADNLQAIVDLSQKYGVKLMFVEPPIDADHMSSQGLNEFQIRYSKTFFITQAKKYRKQMHDIANKSNLSILNHSLSLDNLHQKPLFLDLLHPTPEGNTIMARDIYMQWLDNLPNKSLNF